MNERRLPWLGALLLVAGCGRPDQRPVIPQIQGRQFSSFGQNMVQQAVGATTGLPMTSDTEMNYLLPGQCRIALIGPTVGIMSNGIEDPAVRPVFNAAFAISALTKAMEHAVNMISQRQAQFSPPTIQTKTGSNRSSANRQPAGPPAVMDNFGGWFFPKPGSYQFTISTGDAKVQGFAPIGDPAQDAAIFRDAATRLVDDSLYAQDEALAPIAGAPDDAAVPPPGYKIRFGGRGLRWGEGPPIKFGPISVDTVAKRLQGVLMLLTKQDAIDPNTANYPQPDQCHVGIEGPTGSTNFDYPCSGGWTDASAKAVAAKVQALAKQIESVNAKVVSSLPPPPPPYAAPPPVNLPPGSVVTTVTHGPNGTTTTTVRRAMGAPGGPPSGTRVIYSSARSRGKAGSKH